MTKNPLFTFYILVRGEFISGTPMQCPKAPSPRNGRWICSYGFGENGRSLCMVDCRKEFIIADKPLIFNCDNGVWRSFPAPDLINIVPHGECVPADDYFVKKSKAMWRRTKN